MEFEEAIARLGERLDAWYESNEAVFASDDRAAQANALLGGLAIVHDLEEIKRDALAAITALLDAQRDQEDEHVASLVRGFELASQVKAALSDELSDVEGHNQLALKMYTIATTLDQSRSGRAALAVLLDHAKDCVRASAGAFLVDLMPDRVVPLLSEIDARCGGTAAGFSAHFPLVDWQLRHNAYKISQPSRWATGPAPSGRPDDKLGDSPPSGDAPER